MLKLTWHVVGIIRGICDPRQHITSQRRTWTKREYAKSALFTEAESSPTQRKCAGGNWAAGIQLSCVHHEGVHTYLIHAVVLPK